MKVYEALMHIFLTGFVSVIFFICVLKNTLSLREEMNLTFSKHLNGSLLYN